jgi:hypothetical protein
MKTKPIEEIIDINYNDLMYFNQFALKTVTINYNTVALEVKGNYTQAVDGVMWDGDLAGYPDEPSEFEIVKVLADGFDITEVFLDSQLEEITELCLNQLE